MSQTPIVAAGQNQTQTVGSWGSQSSSGGTPLFSEYDGILVPRHRPQHRADEYDEEAFDLLLQMQRRHFWYGGRHRLLLNVLRREIARHMGTRDDLRAVDIGAGCGGWIEYLHAQAPGMFRHLAIADSSPRALSLAGGVVGSFAQRYHVDLLDLPWDGQWDVVFLLDVIEHIGDDAEALRQVGKSLRPGGLLVVTVPALQCFWTYNDDIVHHRRRYSMRTLRDLAANAGLNLLRTEYFMFFLSPALLLSRMLFKPSAGDKPGEIRAHLARTHRVPPPLMNLCLTQILLVEAWLVNRISFPWGTSVLAVFQR